MNVPMLVKVPIDIAKDLDERLRVLQKAHEEDMQALDKKIKLGKGDPKKLITEREALLHRGRRLTMTNLVRVSVLHGAANVALMKDEQIHERLAETGLVRGRPRAA